MDPVSLDTGQEELSSRESQRGNQGEDCEDLVYHKTPSQLCSLRKHIEWENIDGGRNKR